MKTLREKLYGLPTNQIQDWIRQHLDSFTFDAQDRRKMKELVIRHINPEDPDQLKDEYIDSMGRQELLDFLLKNINMKKTSTSIIDEAEEEDPYKVLYLNAQFARNDPNPYPFMHLEEKEELLSTKISELETQRETLLKLAPSLYREKALQNLDSSIMELRGLSSQTFEPLSTKRIRPTISASRSILPASSHFLEYKMPTPPPIMIPPPTLRSSAFAKPASPTLFRSPPVAPSSPTLFRPRELVTAIRRKKSSAAT